MHAGKNADSHIHPDHLGLLTEIHTFICTMMNPQVCCQSQQQDALLLSRMFIFTFDTPTVMTMSHISQIHYGGCWSHVPTELVGTELDSSF